MRIKDSSINIACHFYVEWETFFVTLDSEDVIVRVGSYIGRKQIKVFMFSYSNMENYLLPPQHWACKETSLFKIICSLKLRTMAHCLCKLMHIGIISLPPSSISLYIYNLTSNDINKTYLFLFFISCFKMISSLLNRKTISWSKWCILY